MPGCQVVGVIRVERWTDKTLTVLDEIYLFGWLGQEHSGKYNRFFRP
jgi:hypothetical protein